MPTFTGVCSWGDLPTILTDHLKDSQILTPSPLDVYATGDVLYAYAEGNNNRVTSSWPSDPFQEQQIVEAFVERDVGTDRASVGVMGWNGSSWITLQSWSTDGQSVVYLPGGITRLQVYAQAGPYGYELAHIKVSQCSVIHDSGDVAILNVAVYWTQGLSKAIGVRFSPYNCTFTSEVSSYPVQYLLLVGEGYIILAVQGVYQVDSSARTHIVYTGQLITPSSAPLAYAGATTMGSANLMATLSDNRRASVQSTYSVYPSRVPVSPDIQNRFALVPIYVYHPDENWRGWFKDLYVAQIPPQTMLNGETVTAQDGSKYTFFNIPPSGDGYYNNFLAADATNQWLVVKH